MNACGFAPSNNEKIEMMVTKCQEMGIDVLLLNETNTKWNYMNQDKITRRLKVLGREINIKTSDSGRWELTKKEWLPGGALTAVRGRIASLVVDDATHRGKYGNWLAVKLVGKGKTVAIINIYRIPATSPADATHSSLIQCDLIDGKAKTAAQHRSDVFKEIEEHIKKNNDMIDMLLAGDINQSVASKTVQKFFNSIGVMDVHQKCDDLDLNQLDNTESRGSNPIDAVAVSHGLMEHVESSMLNDCNDIKFTDHRSYIIDINFEDYFEDHLSA